MSGFYPTVSGRFHDCAQKMLDARVYFTISRHKQNFKLVATCRDYNEYLIDLLEMVVRGGSRRSSRTSIPNHFVYSIQWHGTQVNRILDIIGQGEHQREQVAIVREYIESKKEKKRVKRTDKFRAYRMLLKNRLLDLNTRYFEALYPTIFPHITVEKIQARRFFRELVEKLEPRPKREKKARVVKKKVIRPSKLAGVAIEEVFLAGEELSLSEIFVRMREVFDIGEVSTKRLLREAVENKRIFERGKLRSRNRVYFLPPAFEEVWSAVVQACTTDPNQ